MLFFFFDNLGFVWLFLILGAMRRRDTPPAPLKRGGWNVVFSLIILVLCGCFWFEVAMRGRDTPPAPLKRGDGESDLFV